MIISYKLLKSFHSFVNSRAELIGVLHFFNKEMHICTCGCFNTLKKSLKKYFMSALFGHPRTWKYSFE